MRQKKPKKPFPEKPKPRKKTRLVEPKYKQNWKKFINEVSTNEE